MGGDSYRNALLMIKGCNPQQRWSDCVCTGGKTRLRLLAEQTRQQRNQGDAYQSDTAASHELLHALRLGAGEKLEIISKTYLWLSGSKSQGMKQLMAGGGVALVGITLIPLLSGLFG